MIECARIHAVARSVVDHADGAESRRKRVGLFAADVRKIGDVDAGADDQVAVDIDRAADPERRHQSIAQIEAAARVLQHAVAHRRRSKRRITGRAAGRERLRPGRRPEKDAAQPAQKRNPGCEFHVVAPSDVVRSTLGHDEVVEAAAVNADSQSRHRRGAPIVAAVEDRKITVVVDHEQQMVLPLLFEARARHRARAPGWITDQDTPVSQALDHHEVAITALVHQHDGRQVFGFELVQGHHEAVRVESARSQEPLDVQQRKTLPGDPGAISVRIHLRERRLLADRIAVLVRQQRGDRRGAATEVVLLVDRVVEARFLQAGHADVVVAARKARHLDGPCQGEARQQRQHQQPDLHCWICTSMIVAFWISTLLPLFWITIGTPTAPEKAPPPMLLNPVLTSSVLVLETPPLSVIRSVIWVPPLRFASASVSTLRPNPATKTVGSAWSATAAGGGDVCAPAAPAHTAMPSRTHPGGNFGRERIGPSLSRALSARAYAYSEADIGAVRVRPAPMADSMTADVQVGLHVDALLQRSEERRVGKECRSRWAAERV